MAILIAILSPAALVVAVIALVRAATRSRVEHFKAMSRPPTPIEWVGAAIVVALAIVLLYDSVGQWLPWMAARAPWSWLVAAGLMLFLGYAVLSKE